MQAEGDPSNRPHFPIFQIVNAGTPEEQILIKSSTVVSQPPEWPDPSRLRKATAHFSGKGSEIAPKQTKAEAMAYS
jgi:hypothetical protein